MRSVCVQGLPTHTLAASPEGSSRPCWLAGLFPPSLWCHPKTHPSAPPAAQHHLLGFFLICRCTEVQPQSIKLCLTTPSMPRRSLFLPSPSFTKRTGMSSTQEQLHAPHQLLQSYNPIESLLCSPPWSHQHRSTSRAGPGPASPAAHSCWAAPCRELGTARLCWLRTQAVNPRSCLLPCHRTYRPRGHS